MTITVKENGKLNACFQTWSSFGGDVGGYFALTPLLQKTHTYLMYYLYELEDFAASDKGVRKVAYTNFVRIDRHQQGLGKILMQHIEDIARQQGKNRLNLRASVSAVVFYQKLGYAIVEEIEERIGDTVIKVVEMSKT